LNGSTTLDPEKDHNLLRRIAWRKKLFMDPLVKSGFLKGKRVLDLGSNAGYWSYVALIEGGAARVTGIEASPEIIKQAEFVFRTKDIHPTSYTFRCRGAYEFLEEVTEPFDVILWRQCRHVLAALCTGWCETNIPDQSAPAPSLGYRARFAKRIGSEPGKLGLDRDLPWATCGGPCPK
jgi:SAM-dependent methyltransferase